MKYYGKIRYMTNVEWVFKNWDKEIDNSHKTIGRLFPFKNICSFITMKYCEKINGNCKQCVYTWLQSEAAKDNNIYFDDVQED